MVNPSLLPNAASAIADQRGAVSKEWRDFFLKLANQAETVDLRAQYEELARRVTELEQDDDAFSIQGLESISVQGTPSGGVVQITLQGDDPSPGGSYVYGTQDDGTKAWRPLTSRKVINFSFGDASPSPVFTAPHDLTVIKTRIVVRVPLTGTAPELSVGTSALPQSYITPAQNDAKRINAYETTPDLLLLAGQQLFLTITPDGSSAGSGQLVIDTIPVEGN